MNAGLYVPFAWALLAYMVPGCESLLTTMVPNCSAKFLPFAAAAGFMVDVATAFLDIVCLLVAYFAMSLSSSWSESASSSSLLSFNLPAAIRSTVYVTFSANTPLAGVGADTMNGSLVSSKAVGRYSGALVRQRAMNLANGSVHFYSQVGDGRDGMMKMARMGWMLW